LLGSHDTQKEIKKSRGTRNPEREKGKPRGFQPFPGEKHPKTAFFLLESISILRLSQNLTF
jgi:hypothetical protein